MGLPLLWRLAGAEPGRGRTLRVRTPAGHVVDFQHAIDEVPVHGLDGVHLPMRRSHLRRGVAPTRLDHVNVRVTDVTQARGYWRDELGFSVSETVVEDDGTPRIVWLRRTQSSHDVAMGPDAVPGLHHVAFAMRDAQALVAAADVLSDAGLVQSLEYGPGRHGVTDAFFLYIKDPDGNRIELYAGDYLRDLDRPPIVWSTEQYAARGLLWWGHAPPPSFRTSLPLLERGLVPEPAGSAA
jgi:catechol 2,3-dioxygenase